MLKRLGTALAVVFFTRPRLVSRLVALAGLITVPLITLWSLNTVFDLGIAYSLSAWFAVSFLLALWSYVSGTTARLLEKASQAERRKK